MFMVIAQVAGKGTETTVSLAAPLLTAVERTDGTTTAAKVEDLLIRIILSLADERHYCGFTRAGIWLASATGDVQLLRQLATIEYNFYDRESSFFLSERNSSTEAAEEALKVFVDTTTPDQTMRLARHMLTKKAPYDHTSPIGVFLTENPTAPAVMQPANPIDPLEENIRSVINAISLGISHGLTEVGLEMTHQTGNPDIGIALATLELSYYSNPQTREHMPAKRVIDELTEAKTTQTPPEKIRELAASLMAAIS